MTLAPLLEATLAIQIHTWSAILAFFLGGLVLFRRKGDPVHRMGGRVWVGLMLVVAFSSLFIHSIQLVGIWSPIHLLTLITFWFLVQGVNAARRRRIQEHRGIMLGLYFGALIIAGAFTFLPGRIMHRVFFEGPQPWIGITVAAAIVAYVIVLMRKVAMEWMAERRRTASAATLIDS